MTESFSKQQDLLTAKFEKVKRRKNLQVRLLEHWYLIAVLILTIYVGLPFAAPVLMKVGAEGPANTIYKGYSYMCHQFAFRSIFLFGEQVWYPRELADTNVTSFETRAAQSPTFVEIYQDHRQDTADFVGVFDANEFDTWSRSLQFAARDFKGDEQMGYKVALCQRDVAIYVAMVVAGIVYGFVRKRLRPAPFWLYIMLGLAPIGLDGFSQLLGYPPFELWEPRETLPGFRLLTGALFGLMNVWIAFPYINESMTDSARRIRSTLRRLETEIKQLGSSPPGVDSMQPDSTRVVESDGVDR